MKRRIVIAVGLTGGHIYPALSMAEDLGRENFEYLFVARKNSPLAERILEKKDWPVVYLDAQGLPRGWHLLTAGFSFLVKQLRSMCLLWRVCGDWKPDLAVGFGGYISFPLLLAAYLRRVPAFIFEPNAVMGLANRISAAFADKVVLAMPASQKAAKVIKASKVVIVEPPLRKALKDARSLPAAETRKSFGLNPGLPCVVIFGGSQGARAINREASRAVWDLRRQGCRFAFVHIAGISAFDEIRRWYADKAISRDQGICLDYLEEMGRAYAAADIVISRSGAITCLELLYFGKRAVLVPLVPSPGDHQFKNARYLNEIGIARIVPEEKLAVSLAAALKEELANLRFFSAPTMSFSGAGVTLAQVARQVLWEI